MLSSCHQFGAVHTNGPSFLNHIHKGRDSKTPKIGQLLVLQATAQPLLHKPSSNWKSGRLGVYPPRWSLLIQMIKASTKCISGHPFEWFQTEASTIFGKTSSLSRETCPIAQELKTTWFAQAKAALGSRSATCLSSLIGETWKKPRNT